MNTSILQKCITELEKDAPNLAYLKGILETLVEMSGTQTPTGYAIYTPSVYPTLPYQVTNATTPLQGSGLIELSNEEREQEELARKYAGGPISELQ